MPKLLLWLGMLLSVGGYAQQSSVVHVKGAVENPLRLGAADLGAFQIHERKNIRVVSSNGEVRKTFERVRGVLLKDVLAKAKPLIDNPKEKGRYVIVASATDGYVATFSYHEVLNNPLGNDVLLLIEENGQPIAQDGDVVLISLSDYVTGNRHVKWLSSIELRKL